MDAEGIILRAKLTKKLFKSLPAGSYLVSNLVDSTACPVFQETVKPDDQRGEQWDSIVRHGAEQRLCTCFKDKASSVRWMEKASRNLPDHMKF